MKAIIKAKMGSNFFPPLQLQMDLTLSYNATKFERENSEE